MTSGLFAYDPQGRLFAIACGPELLVHEGGSEAPLWRKDLGEALVGVGVAGDEIVALGESGSIARFGIGGRELGRVSLGAPAHALAVAPGGWMAAAHDERVSVMRRGDLAATEIPRSGVSAMAWSQDGTKLLLGGRDGSLVQLRAPSWSESGEEIAAGEAIGAACWSARGVWLVASGDRVLRLSPGDTETTSVTRASGHTVTALASSLDGARFAMQLGDTVVAVLEDPPAETLAQLRYPERRACGVAFGPPPWLGVALDTGDANKLDVDSGALHRSDTHPERTHNSWLVAVSTAADAKREAAEKKTKKDRPRAAPRPAPLAADLPTHYDDPPPADDGPSPWLVLRLVIAGIVLLLSFLRLLD
jgi:hypothetical protein